MDSALCVAGFPGNPTESPCALTVDEDRQTSASEIRDPDWPLIKAISGGDQRALDHLMQRHQPALFYFVLRYLGNETAARDAVQETFVRVWFKAGGFRPRSTVKTWIHSIALNYCRDAARKVARAPKFTSFDEAMRENATSRDLLDPGESPHAEADGADRLAELRQAISQLPDRLKSALVLCVLEQRSHKEAAEILHTTPKSVELRVYRAKAKLRRWLSGVQDVGPLEGAINVTPV